MGIAATMWVLMSAEAPILSPNDHPNPSRGDRRVSEKLNFQKKIEVQVDSQNNSNFRAFGGRMAWAICCVCSHGSSCCNQMTTLTHPQGP